MSKIKRKAKTIEEENSQMDMIQEDLQSSVLGHIFIEEVNEDEIITEVNEIENEDTK